MKMEIFLQPQLLNKSNEWENDGTRVVTNVLFDVVIWCTEWLFIFVSLGLTNYTELEEVLVSNHEVLAM